MLRKLFGETDEEQFMYLKPRLIVLGVAAVLVLIAWLLSLTGAGISEMILSAGQLVWIIITLNFGWAILRGLFGIASIGVLFSRNFIFGAAIFVIYIMVGWVGGIVVSVIGLCRFLVLLKKRK